MCNSGQVYKPVIIVVDLYGPDSPSWENLLTLGPKYKSFAGVFKDIAKLPHVNSSPENVKEVDYRNIRPLLLGEYHDQQPTDEEYI